MSYCKIIIGNAFKYLPQIESGTVDMVFTDPPYMISSAMKIRRQRNPMKFNKPYKYQGKDISFEFGEWDIFKSKEEYLDFTKSWFTECIRILRKGGHVISFFDKHKLTYLVELGEELNVKARQNPLWIKTNPVPCGRKVSFMNGYELCYWGTKETTQRKFCTFNYELGQSPDYFKHSIVGHTTKADGERIHSTQKPIAFCQWLISYLSNENDLIIDPFAGSGTTGMAAILLNRNVILIEKDKDYAEKMILRIKNLISQQNLFKKSVKLEIFEI